MGEMSILYFSGLDMNILCLYQHLKHKKPATTTVTGLHVQIINLK